MKKRIFLDVGVTLSLSILACSFQLIPPLQLEPTPLPVTAIPISSPFEEAVPEPVIASGTSITGGDLTRLYEQVNPGVVTIWVFDESDAPDEVALPIGQGSGFVIDRQGHIITNQHVVAGAAAIEVDFTSGMKSWAELIGVDLDSDLAVLKVDVPDVNLAPLPMGDSDEIKVGEFVVAIGNPFGLRGTMTVGIVSAIGRSLESEHLTPEGIRFSAGDLIQTDAAINPGNSGGPLLNLNGQVIGINRAIQTETFTVEGSASNSGVGFAIPVNILRSVAPAIIRDGHYDYPYLGISSLNDRLWNLKVIETLGFGTNVFGAYITEVVAGGPADAAGLRGGSTETSIPGLFAGGDLLIAIDGQIIRQFDDMLSYLFSHTEVGQDVELTVIRDNKEISITLTIGARP
ncbi:MAG: trypsin-like peptidase domain-containing protein [Anaerolineales bacterium]|nr:trypsin-like peptidase domain-containing protein [Anaerolineales bacterium]